MMDCIYKDRGNNFSSHPDQGTIPRNIWGLKHIMENVEKSCVTSYSNNKIRQRGGRKKRNERAEERKKKEHAKTQLLDSERNRQACVNTRI